MIGKLTGLSGNPGASSGIKPPNVVYGKIGIPPTPIHVLEGCNPSSRLVGFLLKN